MTDLWWGVAIGGTAVALLGGPLASRLSARLEAGWDRSGDHAAAHDRALANQVEQLVADSDQFAAYQAQYWTWAGIVGGAAVGLSLVGFLIAWALDRGGSAAAGPIAGATAVVVGGLVFFWLRKLMTKRRATRLVYRKRRMQSR